ALISSWVKDIARALLTVAALQLIAQAAPTIDHPATSLVRGAQSRRQPRPPAARRPSTIANVSGTAVRHRRFFSKTESDPTGSSSQRRGALGRQRPIARSRDG